MDYSGSPGWNNLTGAEREMLARYYDEHPEEYKKVMEEIPEKTVPETEQRKKQKKARELFGWG